MTSHKTKIHKKPKRNNSFRTKHFTKKCHRDDDATQHYLSLSLTRNTVTHKAENESEIRTSFI